MSTLEIGLSVIISVFMAFFWYAVRYVNALQDRIIGIEKEIIRIKCKYEKT